ncbi:hypothetical protein [Nonomuraea salmonea]|uniref:hypothetical protein n=1 Tax=Nonomuraea salmonea TaxID=46181 RepID=UPI0031E72217
MASPATRAEAERAIARLSAHGGTAIGEWIKLAGHLLTAHPSAIKHALLMTDGQNNQSDDTFADVLAAWSGKFVVDSLGVGDDWVPAELRKVAEAMLGTFDFVRNQGGPAGVLPQAHADLDEQDRARPGAARVGAAGGAAEVRQTGLAHAARPDRQAHRRQPADRRLPDRLVGGRRSASTTSASRCRRARSGRRSGRAGSSWYAPTRRRSWPAATCWRSGRTTWRSPPASTARSPTTPARPSCTT